MFITEHLTPAETLSELLALRGCTQADTARFRGLRHNKHLCPGFRERVSVMLDAYKSHRTDVHDTQGPRDGGIDVHMNYEADGQHRVGLQIKSYDEIEAWAMGKDPGFIQRLKAQYATAIGSAKVEDYCILLCADEIRHHDPIRTICSEFKDYERVKVVLPRQALALYEATDDEVRGYVSKLLCRRDAVLEAALDVVSGLPGDHAYILVALVCRAMSGERRLGADDLVEIHGEWLAVRPADDPRGDRLAEMLWDLSDQGLSMAAGDTGFDIDMTRLPTPLYAMYFDQKQRCGGDPLETLTVLLGIRGRRLRMDGPGGLPLDVRSRCPV